MLVARQVLVVVFIVSLSALSVSAGAPSGQTSRVTVCHVPPGNPAQARTIEVGRKAVAAHLKHGDSLGDCPQACEGAPAPLAKTGQTACWDEQGTPIECVGTGQDGEYQAGVSVDPRFTDNGNGTVTDNLTGLIWLLDANCFSTLYWNDALTAANSLASGSCGLTDGSLPGDWRLPNIRELQSLVDYGQNLPAIPLDHPFVGVVPDNYWSSTVSANDPSAKWSVYLGYGYAITQTNTGCYVWPVRGGQ